MFWVWTAAIAGMVLYGVASVAQAYAAQVASGPDVLRHPAYAAGLACDGLAWLCSLAALLRLPLFVVQSVLAGSLAVTVVLARLILHVPMQRRDWLAVVVTSVGLLLVSASAAGESTAERPQWFDTALWITAGLLVAAAAALYGRGGSIPLTVVGSLGFSTAALGARAAHLGEGSLTSSLTNPLLVVVLVTGVIGAVCYARSLERGAVGPATATLWVVEVIVPGLVGVIVLGDAVRPGWVLPALLGVVIAIAGCGVLAQSPAQG